MRCVRAALLALVVLIAGCTSDEPPTASESDAATETEVTQAPTTEATTSPTPEPSPTDDTAAQGEPATALFVPLGEDYEYEQLPGRVNRQLQSRLGGIENNPLIDDVATRYVERGSVPVAAVIAVRFNENATSADIRSFAEGVTQAAGVEGKPVELGGKDVLYIPARPRAFLYAGDDFALLFFGASRKDLKPVVAAAVQGVG